MKFSQKAFRAAAAALSALLLAGCTGMLWLSYVQNGKISFEDGRTFRIGDALNQYQYCKKNTESWTVESGDGGHRVLFSCHTTGEDDLETERTPDPSLVLNVEFLIPSWSLKYDVSRVWYAVDLADGTDPAAQAVMKTANPHESLREIALGRDVSIPPDEFMKWAADGGCLSAGRWNTESRWPQSRGRNAASSRRRLGQSVRLLTSPGCPRSIVRLNHAKSPCLKLKLLFRIGII